MKKNKKDGDNWFPGKMTLTIEYQHRVSQKHYVRFDADEATEDGMINLFCCDDKSGSHDIRIKAADLKKDFIEIDRRMEES